MGRMIQIRNVPDHLHRTFKVRAAQAGMSLSDYLLAELRTIAERPTLQELIERVRAQEPVRDEEESSAEIIRRHRDA